MTKPTLKSESTEKYKLTILQESKQHPEVSRKAIPDCIEKLKTHEAEIEEIDLSDFNISDEDAVALAEVFYTNKTLKEVYLNHCDLTDYKMAVICNALEQNPSLQKIDFGGNPFDMGGRNAFSSLQQTIDRNNTPQFPSLHSQYSPETVRILRRSQPKPKRNIPQPTTFVEESSKHQLRAEAATFTPQFNPRRQIYTESDFKQPLEEVPGRKGMYFMRDAQNTHNAPKIIAQMDSEFAAPRRFEESKTVKAQDQNPLKAFNTDSTFYTTHFTDPETLNGKKKIRPKLAQSLVGAVLKEPNEDSEQSPRVSPSLSPEPAGKERILTQTNLEQQH